MIEIKYEEWYKLCDNIEKYIEANRKFYMQLYPITNEVLENLKERDYFNTYIKTQAFLWNDINWIKCENPSMNLDGTFRNRNLISPIFYLLYVYFGNKINMFYKEKRNNDIEVYYAGNFNESKYHYKGEYNTFCQRAIAISTEYKYYIKTDVKDFFNNVNMELLFHIISSNINSKEVNISLNEINFIKEFIKYLGDGKLPQIEEGITSSYLATKIYLEEVDNRTYNFLKFNNEIINFKMIRYVDDLYIFINPNADELDNIFENLLNFLNDNLYEFNLRINMNKTEMKGIESLKEDLKHLSYLDEQYIKENINEIINDTSLHDVLFDILLDSSVTKKEYNKILKMKLGNIDKYSENEILNSILYTNNSIITNQNMIDILELLIEQKFKFIYCDPKRISILITKTKNEKIIKKFLNKMYQKQRKLGWNRYDKIAVEQYLLQRGFNSNDLKRNLKSIVNFEQYINSFMNCNWSKTICDSEKMTFLKKILFAEDYRCFTLFSYYKMEENKQNYELKLSFFKSYFEAITALLYSKYINKKPDYKRTYKERTLQKNYMQIFNNTNYNSIIHEICQLRNENIVNHAGGYGENKNIYEYIDQKINEIIKMINKAVKIISMKP